MFPFLKKKKSIEDITHGLIKESLHKAYEFYRNENDHARNQLSLDEKEMREVGAGMCLFFLTEYLSTEKNGGQAIMGRAYAQVKKDFRTLHANPQKSYDTWKAFNDAFLLHDDMDRVEVATRLAWERLLPERKFIAQTPLHSYAYFLQLQVKDVETVKII